MTQSPIPNEPSEPQRAGLPMVLPEPGSDPREGWMSRVMRILFGWRASSATRADLELVLTADQPESGFSPTEATMLKNILGLRECRIESVMVPRTDIVAVQQDVTIGDGGVVQGQLAGDHARQELTGRVVAQRLLDPVGDAIGVAERLEIGRAHV